LLQGGGASAGGGGALPRVPTVDFAQFGPIEIKPLNRIQRISGTACACQLGQPAARHAV
jgi:pyruvate dehydrogenase E2 component (dihydrolipoamide acetyltransferase)